MKETRIYEIISSLPKDELRIINKLDKKEKKRKCELIEDFFSNYSNLYLNDPKSREIVVNGLSSKLKDEITKKYNMDLETLVKKSFEKVEIEKDIYNMLDIKLEMKDEELILKDEKTIEIIENTEQFYELLDYQFVIKQKILATLKSDQVPRILVHMPTGTGKTKTSMHTIINHYLNELHGEGIIIWMAHTDILLDQAFKTFKEVWEKLGSGNVKAYRHYGNNTMGIDEIDNGFVFAGFQKLISTKNKNEKLFNHFCNRCRLIVVDEAHKSTANETKKVIDKLLEQRSGMLTRGLLGLTATPGRTVGENTENEKLVNLYENRIIGIDTGLLVQLNENRMRHFRDKLSEERDVIKYLQGRRVLAKIKRQSLDYGNTDDIKMMKEINKKSKDDFSNNLLDKFGKIDKRNIVIVEKLKELSLENKPTIVFACSVEHGKLIAKMLDARNIKNVAVYGEMDRSAKEKSIKLFKDRNNDINIIINYEVLTTGFDSTNIQCVFITRPTQSIVLYSQMLGRGLRGPQMGGNEECLLIDIEDNLKEYTSESMAFEYFNNYWSN